jgi:hypothetical protein
VIPDRTGAPSREVYQYDLWSVRHLMLAIASIGEWVTSAWVGDGVVDGEGDADAEPEIDTPTAMDSAARKLAARFTGAAPSFRGPGKEPVFEDLKG